MPDSLSHCLHAGQGHFQACVNDQPLQVTSLLGQLTLRPDLSRPPGRQVWKVIADGKVGRRRTSIGLFFDHDLLPGTYDLTRGDPRIRMVYNETPHRQSVIYHCAHLQSGTFTLLDADCQRGRVQGRFEFGIHAIGFAVQGGGFDLPALSAAGNPQCTAPTAPGTAPGQGPRPSAA